MEISEILFPNKIMKSNRRKVLGILHIGLKKYCDLKTKIVLSDTFEFFSCGDP